MKKAYTDFNKWFLAQFGRRPSPNREDDDLIVKRNEGLRAEIILRQNQIWDERRKAALKWWYAKAE